ncbi:hypothetical protein TNCV_4254811 [Trichonephila clavipes]|nr:hypothetical protein TNCV_4254811 [Trichonephila clavipes]
MRDIGDRYGNFKFSKVTRATPEQQHQSPNSHTTLAGEERPGEGSGAFYLSSPSTNLTRRLTTRRLFREPLCRHLQTSMSSPGFKPSPYSTAVRVANHYTGWAISFHAGGINGPYFFKTDEGHNVTVNGDRYRAMSTNFFIPELNNHYVQELWF